MVESDTLLLAKSMDIEIKDHQTSLKNEWNLKLGQECWICDKSSFAMVFFNAKKPIEHMDVVFDPNSIAFLNQQTFGEKPTPSSEAQKQTAPMVSGSVTGWNSHKMVKVNQFSS
jgi:enoyl-[acyl-carrier-protein] reductase (NADH)